jgi:hypothetical protein
VYSRHHNRPSGPSSPAGAETVVSELPLGKMSGNARFVSRTPDPSQTRSWETSVSSVQGNNWTGVPMTAFKPREISEDGATSIMVEDLNSSIPHSDLEQGLHGLFSVFGNVSNVKTMSDGELFSFTVQINYRNTIFKCKSIRKPLCQESECALCLVQCRVR